MDINEIDTFKSELREIKEHNIDLGAQEKYEKYADKMLILVGNTDPELRDRLIYSLFVRWMDENRLSKDYLKKMLSICLDEKHLFYRMNEKIQEAVFTRSFSALLIECILEVNLEDEFISNKEVEHVLEKMLLYYSSEKDYRGYTGDMGWAHAMAHGADVFYALSLHKSLDKKNLQDILNVFISKICQGEYVFIDEEPDRMLVAIMTIIKRNEFSDEELMEWMNQFENRENERMSIQYYHTRVNIKNFFRALYFQAKNNRMSEKILKVIESKAI